MIATPETRERHIQERCVDALMGKIHRGIIRYPTGDIGPVMEQYAALLAAQRPEVEAEYDLYHTGLADLTQRQLMERLRRARADVISARLGIAWALGYAGDRYRNENEAYGAHYEGVAEGHQQAQEAAEEELRDILMERERRRAYNAVETIVIAAYEGRDQ